MSSGKNVLAIRVERKEASRPGSGKAPANLGMARWRKKRTPLVITHIKLNCTQCAWLQQSLQMFRCLRMRLAPLEAGNYVKLRTKRACNTLLLKTIQSNVRGWSPPRLRITLHSEDVKGSEAQMVSSCVPIVSAEEMYSPC